MASLDIYRDASIISTVSIDEKTVFIKKLMAADKITSRFISKVVLPVEIGDYIDPFDDGNKYYLNQLPSVEKQNEKTYKYNMVFHSVLYDMYNKILISSDGLTDFSYTGNAEDMITLLVEQMNEIYSGWTVGDVDETEIKTFQFKNESCRTALTKIAALFQFEFELVGKTINFKEAVGTITEHEFEYGQNKGLYNLTRKSVETNTLVTKVYGFGGTKNIPYTYRDHAKRLVFEERFLTKNVSIYGVREGHYTNEDIYPQRTATLTAVNMDFEADVYNPSDSYVEDSSLDFNINDFLAEGLTAKIVFKSGALKGYQFEIWNYDHSNKRIYFNPVNEADGYILPNVSNVPEVGDDYTLVDISMPQSYIYQAEEDLKAATQVFLDENAVPKSLYIVKLDPKFTKSGDITLDAGDLVKITDTYLGVDKSIRIAQVTYPIVNKYKITAIIADFIPKTLQELVVGSVANFGDTIENIVNRITQNNITNQNITNTTVINEGDLKTITVFDRKFVWKKGFDNILNTERLEAGDVIMDNFYSRTLYIKKWVYIGDDDAMLTRNDRSNWLEYESIDITSLKTLLNKLKITAFEESTTPTHLASLDADGNVGRVDLLRYTNRNIDGGAPDTVYLPTQNIDGGSPASAEANNRIDGGLYEL